MIVTVARYFYFSPFVLDRLYLDAQDHKGLAFWYNDAKQQSKEIEQQSKQ